MHPNAQLLQRLYSSLGRHDHQAMTDCYHPDATFHDIAFDLQGKDQIGSMWRLICSGDIRTTFEIVKVDDCEGIVTLVDEYTFSETGRRVRNPIESRFGFRDGLIAGHRDSCDPRAWAAVAIGGLVGFLAGRLRFLRAWKARGMLRTFMRAERSA
jgi:ketosteroid isomerase-like protein